MSVFIHIRRLRIGEDSLKAGVEVFVFHLGCTRLGALGDDQRGPTVCARGETESVLPLQDKFLGNPEQT